MGAQTKMTMQIEIEPITTRVALHPFLAGMNRSTSLPTTATMISPIGTQP